MSVHPKIQWARGLCTDEAPHEQIDAALSEALDAAKDLEALLREAMDYFEHSSWRCAHPPHYYLAGDPPVDDCCCGLDSFERRVQTALAGAV